MATIKVILTIRDNATPTGDNPICTDRIVAIGRSDDVVHGNVVDDQNGVNHDPYCKRMRTGHKRRQLRVSGRRAASGPA